MTTISDLIDSSAGPIRMPSPRHDDDPDAVRDHINCATDRVISGVPLAECMIRYGLKSRTSVYRYIAYACEYDDDASRLIRIVRATKRRVGRKTA